jgi:hypothetical protein
MSLLWILSPLFSIPCKTFLCSCSAQNIQIFAFLLLIYSLSRSDVSSLPGLRGLNCSTNLDKCTSDHDLSVYLASLKTCRPLMMTHKAQKSSSDMDLYKVLGVSKTATQKEIKHAYRSKSRAHHPDKHGAGSTE